MPATPAMIEAMQYERQRQMRALLVVVALIGGMCAVPVVFILLAGKGANILPVIIPIILVVGIVSSMRMWSPAFSMWQGLLDDLRGAQCVRITGPIEARVTRYSRSPGYSRFALADGREIRVDEELHDALSHRGTPLHGPGMLGRLVGAEPSYDEVRIEGLTVLYTLSAGLVLEIRDAAGKIIHLHEMYGGTTRDPDAG